MSILITTGIISRPPQKIEKDGKKPFTAFTVKETRRWADKAYDTYIKVVAFGKTGEDALNLTEGTVVSCAGNGEVDSYTDKNEKAKYSLKVVANSINVIDTSGSAPATRQGSVSGPVSAPAAKVDDTSDVPF